MTNNPSPPLPVEPLSESEVAEIEARQVDRRKSLAFHQSEYPGLPSPSYIDEIDALCQSLRAAWAETGQRKRTMEFWERTYLAEHETWGHCQWKIENATLRDELRVARAELSEWRIWHVREGEGVNGCGHHPCHQYDLREIAGNPDAAHGCVSCEVTALRDQLAELTDALRRQVDANIELQSKLAEVEKEREGLMREAINDLSRTSIAAEQNAREIDVLIRVREELKSLTLDSTEREKES